MKKAKKNLTAQELDALHDAGVDMTRHWDSSGARRPGLETQRVNVDFPRWMIDQMDAEARRLGVTRQALVKFWISQRLEGPVREKIA